MLDVLFSYLQWATSYYTLKTFGPEREIYSLSDIPLTGDVAFAFPELHPRVRWLSLDNAREPFELGAVLLRNGYGQMADVKNLTVFQCQVLLDALATNRWSVKMTSIAVRLPKTFVLQAQTQALFADRRECAHCIDHGNYGV